MGSSHRYLKDAVDQELMLRGLREFDDRAAYEFLREVVLHRNRRNAGPFCIEREQLTDLPPRCTTDFVEEEARVTRCGAFTARGTIEWCSSMFWGTVLLHACKRGTARFAPATTDINLAVWAVQITAINGEIIVAAGRLMPNASDAVEPLVWSTTGRPLTPLVDFLASVMRMLSKWGVVLHNSR